MASVAGTSCLSMAEFQDEHKSTASRTIVVNNNIYNSVWNIFLKGKLGTGILHRVSGHGEGENVPPYNQIFTYL